MMSGSRISKFAIAVLVLLLAGCTTPGIRQATAGVTLSDGTRLSLLTSDLAVTCPEEFSASSDFEYTCIKPVVPGLYERVETALVANGYWQYEDMQIWSEFCNKSNTATVIWVLDGLGDYPSEVEKRSFVKTAQVAINISPESCDDIMVQDSKIASELGLVFGDRVRVRDTYRNEEGRWVFGYSEDAGPRGIAFYPEFQNELKSYEALRKELARIGFEGSETNPQLGGQGFCRDNRDALFITDYQDDVLYYRQFDYFSGMIKVTDPRMMPLLIQYLPSNGCGMFYG